MSGTSGPDAIPANAVASIVHDVQVLATSQNVRELGEYIASLAANAANAIQQANAPLFFHQPGISNVPTGCTLTFSIGNVDDAVTVRCTSLFQTYRTGEQIPLLSALIGDRGPNVILVILENTGGYNTSVTMTVHVTGAMVTQNSGVPLVQLKAEGYDPIGTQRVRYYIMPFMAV